MPINQWPIDDRPREKLLLKGEKNLSDAELIALFLQTGVRGKNAVDLAKDLLQGFGSLRKVLNAPMNSILQKSGVGEAKYVRLRAAVELGRRYLNENLKPGMTLNNSKQTQKFFAEQLRDYGHEVFACVFLNTHFQLLAYEELFFGTINEARVYPREIVKKGLAHNAAKILLAHNHPSGRAVPSQADIEITATIQQALKLVDITVADHIIVGNPDNFSFAEMGLLR